MPSKFKNNYFLLFCGVLFIFVLFGSFVFYKTLSTKNSEPVSIISNSDNYSIKGDSNLSDILFKKDLPVVELKDTDVSISISYLKNINNLVSQVSSDAKSVVYKNVEKGIDLKYTPQKEGIKEEVIINNLNAVDLIGESTFGFKLILKGLDVKKDQNGDIEQTFTSKKDSKISYTIPPAFMIDGDNQTNYDVKTIIRESENSDEYIVYLVPNKEWLLEKNRKFPVTIDPTIVKGTAPVVSINFDETSGQYAYDFSGNTNTTTLGATSGSESSDPTWKPRDFCVLNSCLYFDGTDDKSSITGAANYSTNTTTVSFWMRSVPYLSGSGGDLVIAKGDNSTKGWYIARSSTTNDLTMRVDTSGSFNQTSKATISSVFDNSWHHITYVIDNAGTITSYKDGQYANSSSFTPGTGIGSSSIDLGMGYNASSSVYYKGFIDNLRIYDYARTSAQVKQDYLSSGKSQVSARLGSSSVGTSLSNGLVGYWKLDEAGDATRLDYSGNSNDLTESTSDTVDLAVGKYGGSGDFERGDTEYLSVADASQRGLDLSSNKFTLSAWVNVESTVGDYEGIITKADTNGQMSYAFGTAQGNNRLMVFLDDDGWAGGGVQIVTGNDIYTIGEWNLFSVTYDGSYIRLYKNGVEQTTGNFPYATNISLYQGTSAFNLGNWGGQTEYYDGKMDEVRVYDRALSAGEIRQLYSFAPGPVVHWNLNENTGTSANDISGNGKTGTLTNSPAWVPGKFGSAVSFSGGNQQITRADDPDLDFIDDADMTFEAWFKHSTATAQEVILSKYNEAGYKILMESDGDITCALDYDAVWSPTDSVTSTLATYDDNSWHHVACVKSGAATLSLFIDGAFIASDSSLTATNTLTNSDPLYIGINDDGSSNDFTGVLDDIKIYNYARTNDQVSADFSGNRTSNLARPISQPIAYYKFDEGADNTCSGGSNDLCNWGTAGSVIDGSQSGFSVPATTTSGWTSDGKVGKALVFDGSNDYVNVPDDNSLDITGDMSISLWLKPSSTQTAYSTILSKHYLGAYILGQDNTNTNSYYFAWHYTGSSYTGDTSSNAVTIPADVWTHYVVVKSGANLTHYLNGVPKLTFTGASATITANSLALKIGDMSNGGGRNWKGTMDELKIYNYALTQDQVKSDYTQGKSLVLGSTGTTATGVSDNSSARAFCPPGNAQTNCAAGLNPAPVGYWKMDEKTGTSALDLSGNGNTGTVGGSTWVSTSHGSGIGTTNNDSVVDSVTISDPASGVLDFSNSSNFSFGLWAKLGSTETASAVYPLTKGGLYISDAGYSLEVPKSGSGSIQCQYTDGNGSGNEETTGPTVDPYWDSSWHYYECVMDRDGSAGNAGYYLYVDGRLAGSDTTLTEGTGVNAYSLELGEDDAAREFTGGVDDVKIYNYARTPSQVAWEYNRGAPALWYKFDECSSSVIGDWAPNSTGGFIGNNGTLSLGSGGVTSAGSCVTTGAWANGSNGLINASMSFDGGDDYVSIGDVGMLYPLTTGYSISLWAKATTWSTSVNSLFSKYATSPSNGQYYLGVYQHKARAALVGTGGTKTSNSSSALIDGSWAHMVVTWSGVSTDPLLIYINGKLDTSTETNQSITAFSNSSESNLIGARNSASPAAFFTGQIDDVRYFKYPLTLQQIHDIYNNGAVSFK